MKKLFALLSVFAVMGTLASCDVSDPPANDVSEGSAVVSDVEQSSAPVSSEAQTPSSPESQVPKTGLIFPEKAKEITLNHAGLKESDITRYKSEKDIEKGFTVYEIEFISGNYKYDYEINAKDGSILKSEKEIND